MIKAIIFDCFGVLASDGWLPFKRKYFGDDPALFEQAGDLNKQVDSGLADYNDFFTQLAELAHITPEAVREQIEQNPVNTELFDYIRDKLKPDYKLGILSNAGGNWLNDMFTDEQVALFDATTLSYEIGLTKPDPRVYQIAAQRLDVQPEECIFIDDQERYCAAAKELGMSAIIFTSTEQLIADLEAMLNQSLAK
jgi:epoxide hydrolase-like predicted phosphatase